MSDYPVSLGHGDCCGDVPLLSVTSENIKHVPEPVAEWSTAAPTVEGYYWLRVKHPYDARHFEAEAVRVAGGMYVAPDGLGAQVFPANALWQGPITPQGVEG